MTRKNTTQILEWIDDGLIDPKKFLESLLTSLSEREVSENLEHIAQVEDWSDEMQSIIEGNT